MISTQNVKHGTQYEKLSTQWKNLVLSHEKLSAGRYRDTLVFTKEIHGFHVEQESDYRYLSAAAL